MRLIRCLLLPIALLVIPAAPGLAAEKNCEQVMAQLETIRGEIAAIVKQMVQCKDEPCLDKFRTQIIDLSRKESGLMKEFEELCLKPEAAE